MTYPQNFEEKIGFDKIRGLICDRCLSTLGSERVAGMQFQTSFDTIDRLLHETEEFTHILQTEDNFPADYFFDIRSSLQRIRIEGTFLDETELFNLRRSLETIRHIVGFFINEEVSLSSSASTGRKCRRISAITFPYRPNHRQVRTRQR